MEKIGQKIKRLRKEKGLTQKELYPSNSNQIAQIEGSRIKNPTEPVLRIIAQNLDMDFEKLIEDTDWNNEQSVSSITEYAFSPTQVIVNLDKSGNIKTTLKSYPAFDKDGNKNKYCPISGDELIRACSKCDRSIENTENMYCMGCGKWLFRSWVIYIRLRIKNTVLVIQLINQRNMMWNIK